VVADGVGLAIIVIGALQAGRQVEVRTAMSWLMVSLLGLAVCGVAHAVWVMRARRSLALATRLLIDPLHRELSPELLRAAPAAELSGAASAETATTTLVAIAGSRRYHRPDCALVTGKPVVVVSRFDESPSDHVPCEVCVP
jgi:hypothetical protein